MSTKRKTPKKSYAKQDHKPVEVGHVSTKAERDARLAAYFAECKARRP